MNIKEQDGWDKLNRELDGILADQKHVNNKLSEGITKMHANDGVKISNIAKVLYQSEEYEACMMAMDDLNIPTESKGEELSIYGRAVWMLFHKLEDTIIKP